MSVPLLGEAELGNSYIVLEPSDVCEVLTFLSACSLVHWQCSTCPQSRQQLFARIVTETQPLQIRVGGIFGPTKDEFPFLFLAFSALG